MNRVVIHTILSAAFFAVVANRAAAAGTHFDNGLVTLEIAEGWRVTPDGDERHIRLMPSEKSGDQILIVLDEALPADLQKFGGVLERLAVSEILGGLKPDVRLSTEQACGVPQFGKFSRWNAVQCSTFVKDQDGYRMIIVSTGMELEGVPCLIAGSSSNYVGDVKLLKEALEILEKTINFNTRTIVDQRFFAFRYPFGWQVRRHDENSVSVTDPGNQREIGVTFVPGFPNNHDTFNQCASEDKLLDFYYHRDYEKLATSHAQYPYTSVTHDDFQPGRLGGRETWVSIVHVEAYQNPVGQVIWMNVVPRAGGVYLVTYRHPGDPMQELERIRLPFIKSINFKSGPLDRNAYCNYLGK